MRKQSTNFKYCKSIVKNAVNKMSETICEDILLVSEIKSPQELETIDQVVDAPENSITHIHSFSCISIRCQFKYCVIQCAE